jgi:hypothetical protein
MSGRNPPSQESAYLQLHGAPPASPISLIIIVSMKSDLEERSEPSLAPFTQNINSFSSRSNQVLRSTHLIRKTSQQKRRLKTNEETVEDVKDLL